MKLNRLLAIVLLASSYLFGAFDGMSISSSTHNTATPSKLSNITFSWAVPITSGATTLNGYYYQFDQTSNSILGSNTNTALAGGATSITSTASNGDGSYYFHIAPYATNGDIGATAHFGPIKIDTTSPTTPIVTPDGGSYGSTKTVTITATDTNNYTLYYTDDGSTPTSASTQYISAISVSSSKTIKAIAIDGAGNKSNIKLSIFTINSTSNVAQFGNEVIADSRISTNDSGQSTTFITSVSVVGTSITKYKYKIDSNDYSVETSNSTAITLPTTEGSHTIYIIGYDGNSWQQESAATTLRFTVDNTSPSAIVLSKASGTEITTNSTITLSSTGSDYIYYTIDSSPLTTNSTNSQTLVLTNANNGEITLEAIALDEAGNKTEVKVATYTVNIPSSGSSGGSSSSSTEIIPEDTSTLHPDRTETEDGSDGSTTQTTTFINDSGESIVVEVISNIDNAITKTEDDGSRTVTASTINSDGKEIKGVVKVNSDATIENSISVGNKISRVKVEIVGADSILGKDYSITTTTPVLTAKSKKITVELTIDKNGEIIPIIKIDNKKVELPKFEVGSSAVVKNENGKITVEIQVMLTKTIRFR